MSKDLASTAATADPTHPERCWPQWMKDLIADAPIIAAAPEAPANVIPFPSAQEERSVPLVMRRPPDD